MRIEVVERDAFLTEESCESRQHTLNVVLRAAGCSGPLPRPHVPTVVIIHHEQQIGLPRPLWRLVHSEVGGSSASPGGARRHAARRAHLAQRAALAPISGPSAQISPMHYISPGLPRLSCPSDKRVRGLCK